MHTEQRVPHAGKKLEIEFNERNALIRAWHGQTSVPGICLHATSPFVPFPDHDPSLFLHLFPIKDPQLSLVQS